ncbi:unnamed protein product [Durusdinium trenchii]|uniref:PPPDE domain-containing protein n=1 Tax=Durusdinium trenchii TaxID=1381693 RepID=A0ABP0QLW6_9DINO
MLATEAESEHSTVDTWQWADDEVPDEQLLEPPRIPQRFNLSLLRDRKQEFSPDLQSGLPEVPDVLWELEVPDEETCFESFPHTCPMPQVRKMGTVREEMVIAQECKPLKVIAGRTPKMCHDDAAQVTSFADKVADLMERVSNQRPHELDGTIHPTPRSPPVLGRLTKSEAGTTFEDVSIPLLKNDIHSQAKEDVMARLPGEEVQPGSKAAAAEDGLFGEVPSVYDVLRNQFADINRENQRYVTVTDFMQFVEWRARQCGGVPAESEHLLQETAKRCFQQASVRREGIRSEDWLHFGLLSTTSPWHLNRRVRRELVKNPQFLRQVLHAFETADVRGEGRLHISNIKASFLNCDELVSQVELAAKNPGQSEELGYYDFVAYCLGYRRSSVKLNWYDVSRGYAKWLPGALLGQDLEGIWHTGIVAFGREYWFGGKVLASEPGKAPFAGPIRCTELGTTLNTKEELEDWLRFDVVSRYTRESYDVLSHNCNHFSDEVAGFLIEGCHIPDEARRQPEALMGTSTINVVRPILNGWLGGFEGGDSSEIDDLTEEWRARLWPGDLCLYDHSGNQKLKLAQVSNVDIFNCTCDISFFDSDGAQRGLGPFAFVGSSLRRFPHLSSSWDWHLVRKSVPLSSLRPHETGVVSGRGALLRPGVRRIDPGIQTILKRKAVVYAHCAQGHIMQQSDGRWSLVSLLRAKLSTSCSICSKEIAMDRKLQCAVCGFYLCSACDRKGLFRGYYSLGSIAAPTARQLLQEPSWISYKAMRYLAAAGKPGGPLSLDIWQGKLAARVYGDLGQDLPSKEELIRQFRHYADQGDGSLNLDISQDQFCALLSEMLATHSFMFHL